MISKASSRASSALSMLKKRQDSEASNFDYRKFQQLPEANRSSWKDFRWLYSLQDSIHWHRLMSFTALLALYAASMEFRTEKMDILFFHLHDVIDVVHNAIYGLHVISLLATDIHRRRHELRHYNPVHWLWYIGDLASYVHYASIFIFKSDKLAIYSLVSWPYVVRVICYLFRQHRPFRYFWNLYEYYLHGSSMSTTIKYVYIYFMMNLAVVNYLMFIETPIETSIAIIDPKVVTLENVDYLKSRISKLFMVKLYITNQQANLIENRYNVVATVLLAVAMFFLLIFETMLATIIVLRLQAEELFRARFNLIMNFMRGARIPESLREKVETFYVMFWHKQRAVSATTLLPTFPPTLLNDVQTDIYFEALQKSIILRDLSYHILSELAKRMVTINYIPGDTIVKRKSLKSSIIYISYGGIEVLTADDDETAMLRFTRGTIINPCGAGLEVACTAGHVSIRAATYCTAHVLNVADLWRVLTKYGIDNGQSYITRITLQERLEKVKGHYQLRFHPPVRFKSSILHFKNNLIELKEARNENGKLLIGNTDIFLEIAHCYIMRNRKSNSMIEETDKICLRPRFPCILQPNSSLLILWSIFVSVVTLIVMIVDTFYFVFMVKFPPKFTFFNNVVTGIFVVDMIVHLSTGAQIEEGVPISFTQSASQKMQTIWFVLDIVSIMPLFEYIGDGRLTFLNRVLKIPQIFHFLQTVNDNFKTNRMIMTGFTHILKLVIAIWVIAVVFYTLQCYVCIPGYCAIEGLGDLFVPGNLTESSAHFRVLAGVFYGISCLVLYPRGLSKGHPWQIETTSILTDNLFYFKIGLIAFFTGIIFYKALFKAGYVAHIIASCTTRYEYNRCLNDVQKFMERNKVNPILRHRFVNYMELSWITDQGYRIASKQRNFLFDLPKHVLQQITAQQRNKYISAIPFMKYVLDEDLKHIYDQAKFFHTSPNEILLNTGDISNEIYVIKRGFCEVISPDTQKVVTLLSSKGSFGDVECLLRLPAYHTVRAVTHVEVYTISRQAVLKSLATPRFRDAIIFAKRSAEYQNLKKNTKEPFLKYEVPPPPPNRQRFPLPRKHLPDTAFILPFTQLGFGSVLRYVFPRFTIRPDGSYLRRYEYFRAVCVIITSMLCPVFSLIRLQFPVLEDVALVLDYLSYFDAIQRMLIGYFDENGILVYHPASTATHYLKGAFLADLMFLLPFEEMDAMRQKNHYENNAYRTTSGYQTLGMNRLGQLYRVPGAIGLLNTCVKREDVLVILKSVPLIMAMISYMVGMVFIQTVRTWRVIGGGWRLKEKPDKKAFCGGWIGVDNNTEETPNRVRFNILGTPLNVIVTTYFWIISEATATNFDRFVPPASGLMKMTMGMLVATFLFWIHVSARVVSIRTSVNTTLAKYQDNMNDIIKYMRREAFPNGLVRDVKAHFNHTWLVCGGIDNRSIYKLCNHITLRTDTILDIYGDTFHKCPVLYNCDMSLLRLLGRELYNEHICKGMSIIERDDVVSNIYFVDYGEVEVRAANDDEFTVVTLPKGSIFGNLETSKYTVNTNKFIAECNIHLLKIETSLFYNIVQDFPSIQVLMKKFRQKSEFQNYIVGSLFVNELGLQGTKAYVPRCRSCTQAFLDPRNKPATLYLIIVVLLGYVANTYNAGFQVNALPMICFLSCTQAFLDPRNKPATLYLIIVVLLGYVANTYNAGFQVNALPMICFLYALDAAFMVKMLLYYLLKFYVYEQAEESTKTMLIRKQYFKGDFIIDVMSITPFELFCLLCKDKLHAFSFLRLNRIMKLVSLDRCLTGSDDNLNTNFTLNSLFYVVVWYSVFVHFCTCGMWWIGEYVDRHQNMTSWRWFGDYDERPPLPDEILLRKYVCVSGIGYVCSIKYVLSVIERNAGAITPLMQYEMLFTCLMMITATYCHIVYEGQFANIIQYRYSRFFNFYNNYQELKTYMQCNRVSRNLINKTLKYSSALWRESRGNQRPIFLDKAPHCLRLNIMSSAYMKHLQWHPLFQQCEKAFRRQMTGCFLPFFYSEDMHVVREGEITDAMYFVHRGRVEEYDSDEFTGFVFDAGTCFGTVCGLSTGRHYVCSYKTTVTSEILTLPFNSWKHLLAHFPRAKSIIYSDTHYKDEEQQWSRRSSAKEDHAPRFSIQQSSSRRQSERGRTDAEDDLSTIRRKSILSYLKNEDETPESDFPSRRKSITIGIPEFGQQHESSSSILVGAPGFERHEEEAMSKRKSITIGIPAFGRQQEPASSTTEDTPLNRRKSILHGSPDHERQESSPGDTKALASKRKSILGIPFGFGRKQKQTTDQKTPSRRPSDAPLELKILEPTESTSLAEPMQETQSEPSLKLEPATFAEEEVLIQKQKSIDTMPEKEDSLTVPIHEPSTIEDEQANAEPSYPPDLPNILKQDSDSTPKSMSESELPSKYETDLETSVPDKLVLETDMDSTSVPESEQKRTSELPDELTIPDEILEDVPIEEKLVLDTDLESTSVQEPEQKPAFKLPFQLTIPSETPEDVPLVPESVLSIKSSVPETDLESTSVQEPEQKPAFKLPFQLTIPSEITEDVPIAPDSVLIVKSPVPETELQFPEPTTSTKTLLSPQESKTERESQTVITSDKKAPSTADTGSIHSLFKAEEKTSEEIRSLWPLDGRKSLAVVASKAKKLDAPESSKVDPRKSVEEKKLIKIIHSDSDTEQDFYKPEQVKEIIEKDDRNLSLDLPTTTTEAFSPMIGVQDLKDRAVLTFKQRPTLISEQELAFEKERTQSQISEHIFQEDIDKIETGSPKQSQSVADIFPKKRDKRASSFMPDRVQSEDFRPVDSFKSFEEFMVEDFSSVDVLDDQKRKKAKFRSKSDTATSSKAGTSKEDKKGKEDTKEDTDKELDKKESKEELPDIDEEGSEIYVARPSNRRKSLF